METKQIEIKSEFALWFMFSVMALMKAYEHLNKMYKLLEREIEK